MGMKERRTMTFMGTASESSALLSNTVKRYREQRLLAKGLPWRLFGVRRAETKNSLLNGQKKKKWWKWRCHAWCSVYVCTFKYVCEWVHAVAWVCLCVCVHLFVWCTRTSRQAVASLLSKTESWAIKERLDIGRETPVALFPQDRGRDWTLSGSGPVASHMALKSDTHK